MKSTVHAAAPPIDDGFQVLDACHRQIVIMLGKLAGLITRLDKFGADEEARAMASEVGRFFTGTARQHHEDEERHVFPPMLAIGNPEVTQTILRLQQDHGWIEEDWLEMAPPLDAVAAGISSYDLDELKAGAEVFTALVHEHIALEESLIYPLARTRLLTGERREMGREMAARRAEARRARRH